MEILMVVGMGSVRLVFLLDFFVRPPQPLGTPLLDNRLGNARSSRDYTPSEEKVFSLQTETKTIFLFLTCTEYLSTQSSHLTLIPKS